MARRAGWAVLCAALAAAAPMPALALQLDGRLDSVPRHDDVQRDLLRREYRLAQALSEQNLRLDELFQRILGTEAAIAAIRAESARPDAVAAVAAVPLAPDPPAPEGDDAGRFAGWLIAFAAGAILLGLARRGRRRPDPAAAPAVVPATLVESPETQIMEYAAPAAAPPAAAMAAEDPDRTVVLTAPPQPEPGSPESDVATLLDLVQVLLAHGSLKGAVIALRDFLAQQPSLSVRPWLKLLEVYREAGMRAEFDEAAKASHQHFNLRIPAWDEGLSGEPLQSFFEEPTEAATAVSVEQVPHVMDRLVAAWGTPEGLDYLRHLLADNRDGARSGFPATVVTDILLLQDILECRLAGTTLPMESDQ